MFASSVCFQVFVMNIIQSSCESILVYAKSSHNNFVSDGISFSPVKTSDPLNLVIDCKYKNSVFKVHYKILFCCIYK